MVLEVRKDLPANTFAEFMALLKQNGAKMQYGSAGAGSTTHLACSLLNARIGADVTHVPYRGSAPATNDLIGGQIDYVCGNLGAAIALINGKQVKALALLSRERSPLMPDLATAGEQGLPDYGVTTWTAFFLPKGAPKEIVDKLERGHPRGDGDAGDQERGCSRSASPASRPSAAAPNTSRSSSPTRSRAGKARSSPAECRWIDEPKPVTGRCLCGDIRYQYTGTPVKILHCHCESCRRHASSPITSFVCVP